jgi:uncharacterized repeat protein (TIGR03803 family)
VKQRNIVTVALLLLSTAAPAAGQQILLTRLHLFFEAEWGSEPVDQLIQGTDGNFYGTTWTGGGPVAGATDKYGGTVFRLTSTGDLTILHRFSGPDGYGPIAGLVQGTDGFFYGTTYYGGSSATCSAPEGCGTVFRIGPAGALTTLHVFGDPEGTNPHGRLVQGLDSHFYGTTAFGGSPGGGGSIFRVTSAGEFSVVHQFLGPDGWAPWAGLTRGSDGNLYGTTSSGYPGYGTVFRITPDGIFTTLHYFWENEGRRPYGGLQEGSDGKFYGTTYEGGTAAACSLVRGCGTVFRVGPSGDFVTLHNFSGVDGQMPQSPPVQGADGNWYGTAGAGGTGTCSDPLGCGTVYRMTPGGAVTTLYAFSEEEGKSPLGLIVGTDGILYGPTIFGGWGVGTIFRIVVRGSSLLPAADFDGDHRADLGIFRPVTGGWYIVRSSTGAGTGMLWGRVGDVPVPADYDGDGKADVAVFRPSSGAWYVVRSSTAQATGTVWGGVEDIAVPGDYDGDRKADLAVFRPSTGGWYIVRSSTGQGTGLLWGASGDIPVPADYDGDGRTDIAVYRPSTCAWYIVRSSTGAGTGYFWGSPGDTPIAADFDGDAKADIAVFRPNSGVWYVLGSTGKMQEFVWGAPYDHPVLGDFDGDGKADVGVFRDFTGTWYIIQTSTGMGIGVLWGTAGDKPV